MTSDLAKDYEPPDIHEVNEMPASLDQSAGEPWQSDSADDWDVGQLENDSQTNAHDVKGSVPSDIPDARDRSLEHYELDDISQQCARDSGRELAAALPIQKWEQDDFAARLSDLRDVENITVANLGVDLAPAIVDGHLPDGVYGYSAGDRVVVSDATLSQDSPQDLVETLSHEYRHQWQDDVIAGTREHPGGAKARDNLVLADQQYQTYDFDAYVNNDRERDAEAFARAVYEEYSKFGGNK